MVVPPQSRPSIRDLNLKKSTTSIGKYSQGDTSPVKQSFMNKNMMFKIKAYLNDAVDGILDEAIATEKSGEPTGNLSQIEMQNMKEMKKRFKIKDLPASNKQSKKEKLV